MDSYNKLENKYVKFGYLLGKYANSVIEYERNSNDETKKYKREIREKLTDLIVKEFE